MSEMDTVKSDQVEPALRDGELDAVTGGAFNAFANFGDIKGECESTGDSSGTQPLRHYSIGFGQPH